MPIIPSAIVKEEIELKVDDRSLSPPLTLKIKKSQKYKEMGAEQKHTFQTPQVSKTNLLAKA